MAEFLIELYVSRTDPQAGRREARLARRAAAELTAQGTPVHVVRLILVRAEETCLLLLRAGSIDAVRAAERLAGLSFEHVAETAPAFAGREPR